MPCDQVGIYLRRMSKGYCCLARLPLQQQCVALFGIFLRSNRNFHLTLFSVFKPPCVAMVASLPLLPEYTHQRCSGFYTTKADGRFMALTTAQPLLLLAL
jgi:hypothetical protein